MDAMVLQSGWSFALLPVASRVGGLLLVAPVFGHAAVPVRLRIALALVVALAVVGLSAGAGARSSVDAAARNPGSLSSNSPPVASSGHWGTSQPETKSSVPTYVGIGPLHRATIPTSLGELIVTCGLEIGRASCRERG